VDCGFAIEWSAAVLEDIRLAVAEAFSSLPHGGTETGGVLFGTRNGDCVSILASRPLACEHALGPTFTLSEKDHARLRALLEEGGRDLCGQDLEPVGWYRSEIFLSDQDVAIHNRYFPDPWQVALLLRPHALKPVRAGFFFREAGEYIPATASFCCSRPRARQRGQSSSPRPLPPDRVRQPNRLRPLRGRLLLRYPSSRLRREGGPGCGSGGPQSSCCWGPLCLRLKTWPIAGSRLPSR